MKSAKLLYLEDDFSLNETVTEYLEESGYEVVSIFDGQSAQDALYEQSFDLLLLDVNVPEPNGFNLLKEARENGVQTPAIFMTSRGGLSDLEDGFNSGADDYIRKPYALKELLLRVQLILKRSFFHHKEEHIQINSRCSFNLQNSRLSCDGEVVPLHNKEVRLLQLFLKRRGHTVSHEEIQSHLWDYEETPSDSSLRTYIKNLRKAVGKEQIENIKRIGYQFS